MTGLLGNHTLGRTMGNVAFIRKAVNTRRLNGSSFLKKAANSIASGSIGGIRVVSCQPCIIKLTGCVLMSRLVTAQPSEGLMYELDAIAAAVIGGTSLSGGIGTISGTLIGAFVIGILRNGLNMGGVSAFIQQIIIGLVILLTVWIDRMRHR